MAEPEAQAEDPVPQPEQRKGGVGRIVLIVVGLFVLITLSQAVTPFLLESMSSLFGDHSEEVADATGERSEKDLPPPIYLPLGEPLVVNFGGQGGIRFLQVGVQIMGREQETLDEADRHMPRIRNKLIMVFSNRDYDTLASREGKEQLRLEALESIREILAPYVEPEQIEDLYFTTFVVQ